MKIKRKLLGLGLAFSMILGCRPIKINKVDNLTPVTTSYAVGQSQEESIIKIKELMERSRYKLEAIEMLKELMPETARVYKKDIDQAVSKVEDALAMAEAYLEKFENEDKKTNKTDENYKKPSKKPNKGNSSQTSQLQKDADKLMDRGIYSKSGLIRKLTNDYGYSKKDASRVADKYPKNRWVDNAVHVLQTKYDYSLNRYSETYLRRKLKGNYGFTQDEINKAIKIVLY